MAGMVDINSFSSQSSQSAEGQIGLGVEEDMEEDQTEGVIECTIIMRVNIVGVDVE